MKLTATPSRQKDAPSVSGASLYFASEPQRFTVGFPRYRVLVYNTTDKTASVSLHAYLTN